MSPWIIAILYDFVLWICRTIWYELPIYGGRAQGRARPRAPSIREAGRKMSIAEMVTGAHGRTQSRDNTIADLRKRDHHRQMSNSALEEEEEISETR